MASVEVGGEKVPDRLHVHMFLFKYSTNSVCDYYLNDSYMHDIDKNILSKPTSWIIFRFTI